MQIDINTYGYIIIGAISGLIIWYLIAKIKFWLRLKKERKKSIKRSKSVILGQVNEKVAPLMQDFEYNYKDLMFLGKGVDYIVFDWLSNGNLKQIVFLEIKSGKSRQNKNERQIEKTIKKKKVKYETMRIS